MCIRDRKLQRALQHIPVHALWCPVQAKLYTPSQGNLLGSGSWQCAPGNCRYGPGSLPGHAGSLPARETLTAADCRRAAHGFSEGKLTSGCFLRPSKHNVWDGLRKKPEVRLSLLSENPWAACRNCSTGCRSLPAACRSLPAACLRFYGACRSPRGPAVARAKTSPILLG